jgi:hypothetical protein
VIRTPMLDTLRRYKDSVTRTESFVVGLAVAFVLLGAIVWP